MRKTISKEQADYILNQFVASGYITTPYDNIKDTERLRKILCGCTYDELDKEEGEKDLSYEIADDEDGDVQLIKDMRRVARDFLQLRADFDDFTNGRYK